MKESETIMTKQTGKPDEQLMEQVASLIKDSSFMVALTGAGISTNAGIPDFRGEKGIYVTGEYPPTVFDYDTFVKNPKIFYTYAKDYIKAERNLQPTYAHRFLADLEQKGLLKHLLTQNVDGLHQKAGSGNVLELHGGYDNSHCINCRKEFKFNVFRDKVENGWVPQCDVCGGTIKPDIVFFGEEVGGFEKAEELVSKADLFLALGTSFSVHPVAYLPELAKGNIIAVSRGEMHISNTEAILIDQDIDEFFKQLSQYFN